MFVSFIAIVCKNELFYKVVLSYEFVQCDSYKNIYLFEKK